MKQFLLRTLAVLILAVVPMLTQTAYARPIDPSVPTATAATQSGSSHSGSGNPSCPASSSTPGVSTSSKDEVLGGVGETGSNCSEDAVTSIIRTAVQILSFVAGIVAVIMIIISGFRFITSGGDTGKVAAAKNSLIYAMVGIAVAALAQLIVHFVLGETTAATQKPKKKTSFAPISCNLENDTAFRPLNSLYQTGEKCLPISEPRAIT